MKGLRKLRVKQTAIAVFVTAIILLNSIAVQNISAEDTKPFFTLVARLPMYYPGGIYADYINFLKQQLERIRINVDVIVQCNPRDIVDLIAFKDFDISCFGLTGSISSTDPDFTGVYNENGSLNVWGYHTSMDWDDELGTGINEWYMKQGTLMVPANSPERIQHYWAWQKHLMENLLPLQPLFARKEYNFFWNELEGYNISDGLLQSWGKMSWDSSHSGQVSTDEIVISEPYSWSDLNPLTYVDASSVFITNFIMDPLVWHDSDMSVQPHLAESFEMLNDTHLRLTMREGIKWQLDPDGLFPNEYLDAKDVFFTFYYWSEMSNKQELFEWIDGMKIIDQYTLDIFIDGDPDTPEKEPYAPIFDSLNNKILPEHYLNQTQLVDGISPDISHTSWSTFAVNGFGTSLFELSDFQEGVETTLEVWNDCWWLNSSITDAPGLNWEQRFGDFTGGLNQLRIKIITDHEMSQVQFEAGLLDIIDFSSFPAPTDAFLLNPNFEYQSDLRKDMIFFAFNMREMRPVIGSSSPAPGDESITKGLAIRKAICYAINRVEINNVIHRGLYKIVDHPIFYKLGIWCNPDIISYDYNLEKAEEYMRIAGFDIGEPTIRISIRMDLIPIFTISILILTIFKKKKSS